jgi:hypothetical protein
MLILVYHKGICCVNNSLNPIIKQSRIMTKKILHFFDRLEDRTRARLSHSPLLYAFIGGIGVVLFWRGVWHTTDFLVSIVWSNNPITLMGIMDGPLSFVLGTTILLITGVFVSAFIGSRLIVTGLSGEKKLAEKTQDEIETEEAQIKKIQNTLNRVEDKINELESEIKK